VGNRSGSAVVEWCRLKPQLAGNSIDHRPFFLLEIELCGATVNLVKMFHLGCEVEVWDLLERMLSLLESRIALTWGILFFSRALHIANGFNG
jgi:hypothetical protein